MSDEEPKQDTMDQLEHLLTRAARHGAKQVVVDQEFVDKIVASLETRMMGRFYEAVGQSIVKKVLGFIIVGGSMALLSLGIKFGLIKFP